MANTLGGLSLTVIAQETLKALIPAALKFNAFTKDFSSDIQAAGGAVSTRIPTAITPQDSTVAGYSAQNGVTTAKTVTLNQAKNISVGFNDVEVTSITLPKLQSAFIDVAVRGLTNDMMSGVLANVTSGNFPLNVGTVAVPSFKGISVLSGVNVLNSGNAAIDGRATVLDPVYYGALMADSTTYAAYAYGNTDIIKGGKIPQLYGTDVYQNNVFTTTASSQGLKGFSNTPDALIIATAVPALPVNFPGEVENITDEDSGLTLQIRKWVDATAGKTMLSASILYGTAVGNSGSLVRYTTAQ